MTKEEFLDEFKLEGSLSRSALKLLSHPVGYSAAIFSLARILIWQMVLEGSLGGHLPWTLSVLHHSSVPYLSIFMISQPGKTQDAVLFHSKPSHVQAKWPSKGQKSSSWNSSLSLFWHGHSGLSGETLDHLDACTLPFLHSSLKITLSVEAIWGRYLKPQKGSLSAF